jgi:hypothetical protein
VLFFFSFFYFFKYILEEVNMDVMVEQDMYDGYSDAGFTLASREKVNK